MDKIGYELFVDAEAAFVLGKVSLVVSPQEDLYVGVSSVQRVNKRLKHRDPVVGSVAVAPKRRKRKAVGRPIRQVELAVGRYAFILRVSQASTYRREHAVEFLS
jgi:hypothetical protein